MISIKEAYELIESTVNPLQSEKVDFSLSTGRILAEDVASDMDMPPFDKSAVDGYACRREDLKKPLKVIEMIPAGYFPKEIISPGTCSKIMTGAKVPEGADCVVMVEYTSEENGFMHFTAENTASNFALKGEDAKKGQVVLKKNSLIDARHIAVMASVGCIEPQVYKQPCVMIFATGNELVDPSHSPGPGQIRNSNGFQTLSQCRNIGINAVSGGVIPDDKNLTCESLKKATDKYDVVILSGGVSKGDLDFIPAVMKELGFNILFDALAVQPGKPTTLAVKGNKYILGLPGNPVSSLVQFNLIGKKLIYALCGYNYNWVSYKIKLANNYKRKKAERTGFLPVILNETGEIEIPQYNGSAHIQALPESTGLLQVDPGVFEIKKGEYGTYRPF